MRTLCFFIILFCFSTSICEAQKLTNSYKRIKPQSIKLDSPTQVVGIDFSAVKFSPKSASQTLKGIFDLAELAQYKLIASYANKDGTSADLKKSIFEPYEKKTKSSVKIIDNERLVIPRRFQFFIHDRWKSKSPANRIVSLRINLTLKSDSVQFDRFEGFQTKYEYIEFGTISGTKNQNFSIGGGLGSSVSNTNSTFDDAGNQTDQRIGSLTPSINTSFGSSSSLTENVSPRQRTISQTGTISGKQMTIYLEGMPSKNLNGLINVDVIMTSDNRDAQTDKEFINFSMDDKNVPTLTPRVLVKPNPESIDSIMADISIEWTYRYVRRNGNTSFEGDDIIEIYESQMTHYGEEKVLSNEDLKVEYFDFEIGGSTVYARSPGGYLHPLTFLSREEAIKFRNYILENRILKVGSYELVVSGGTLVTISQLASLEIVPDDF